jgi:hypothetical protein
MRIFRALSHTKSLPIGRFNFSNPATTKMPTTKMPTIVINVNTPTNIEVHRYNDPIINNKNPKSQFDDLSKKELQQLLDFVV